MRNLLKRSGAATIAALALGLSAPAMADGTFEVLTYNIEGLPPVSGIIPDRTVPISGIGPLLEARHQAVGDQIVGLQEVFHQPYNDAILGATTYTSETVRTTDMGPPPFNLPTGDGLVEMTDFTPVTMTFHNEWSTCNGLTDQGSDCLTPKGYTFTRYELEPGATVDVYNVHMDAGQGAADQMARQTQFGQLQSAMNLLSSDRAVIVMGDTNSKFTRSADVVDTFISDQGLTDVWVDLSNSGVVPGTGADIDSGCPPPRGDAVGMAVDASGPTCELVDKIMFRSGGLVNLSAISYEVLLNFVDMGGTELADHLPVTAVLQYEVVPEPGTAALALMGLAGLGVAGRRRR